MDRLDRFLRSNLFLEAYKVLSVTTSFFNQLSKLVEDIDVESLRSICEEAIEKELGEYSIHQLRKLAAKLAIPYYTTYTKSELLSVLIARRKQEKVNYVQTIESLNQRTPC